MPSSHHLLSSCTNASLWPSFLPKSTTLTQQPSKLMNGLRATLMPSNHKQINTANLSHPCMLVSQLPCMTPFTRFGSPLWWYASYPRTATRYAPVMVLFTTAQDNTYVNAMSSPLTLSQTPQQPHHRLLPDLTSLHHSLHLPSLHNWHSLCSFHLQCLQLWSHRPQLSPSHSCPKGHPCAYACNTQCGPYAAQEIRSCSHSTQVPVTKDVNVPWPMRGEPNLECPQTLPFSFMHT